MVKIKEREKAMRLRKGGKSIREIASVVGVSKSTVSYWCRDISLSAKQIELLADQQAMGVLKSAERKRRDRKQRTKNMMEKGGRDVGVLTERDLFMIGLALYWGEGYKQGSQETALTNSDPAIIVLFIRWLKEIYGVSKNDLILRVSINSVHKNREKEVKKYWVDVTGVPLKQFTKTSFIKAKVKKIYKNRDEHYGTLRVKVRRGTDLRRRILGSIEALKT